MKLQSVKIGGSIARNASFDAPTCLVSSLWFPLASPYLQGKLQNLSFSKVSKPVVMSFCVAGVSLGDILTCLKRVENRFVWQALYFCRFQKMSCSFRDRRIALWRLPCSIRGRRSTSDVLCCVFVANRIVSVKWRQRAIRVAGVGHRKNVILRGKRVIWCGPPCVECPLAWQAQYFRHFTLDTPPSTLDTTYTPQLTQSEHSTVYT